MTDRTAFAVTWDYRCPFARNAHEHVIAGLRGGAPWDVTFVPFSLGQVHIPEGEPAIWSHWEDDTGLLALQAGVVVRDKFAERFHDVHEALFALRHDHGGHLRDADAVGAVLEEQGVDAATVLEEIASGNPIAVVQEAHETAARDHQVWGVPTFIRGEHAVFARLMDRPAGDVGHATRSIDRVLALMDGFPELNEYKHTSIPR